MSLFKEGIKIVHKFSGNNIGYLFNNTVYNSSTSTIGFVFTGKNCIKSVLKGIASPLPWCKGLYFTSATLSGVSCVLSSYSLLIGKHYFNLLFYCINNFFNFFSSLLFFVLSFSKEKEVL